MQMDKTIKYLVEKSNALVSEGKRTTHPRRDEERLQKGCIKWFRYQYPGKTDLLFHAANGERRDKITGAKLKAMGVVSGVADLILMEQRHGYGALCIELKTQKGRLSASQNRWGDSVTCAGYKYVVVRSLDEFIRVVKTYLDEKSY